jgi:D-sedoheptulose 7-phosphate isomerase
MGVKENLLEAKAVLEDFISNGNNIKAIEKAGDIMVKAIDKGFKIIACGNGGSMCDAMHFAEELTGRFKSERAAIPALAISDPSHITCVSNDYGFTYIFSRYVQAMGRNGDVLLAISTSGNSVNVIEAMKVAKDRGMKIIALTGKSGGEMAKICDVEIRAPKTEYSDRAQEIHIKVVHALIDHIERELFSGQGEAMVS